MSDHAPQHTDRPQLGIMLILLSVLTMAFADAVVKYVSENLTLWQVFTVRALFALLLLAAIATVRRARISFKNIAWVFLRSLFLVLSWIAIYASLPVLDLSVAAVAMYTAPLMITLLSALVMGAPVTPRHWGGVFLGFVGVLTILRPGGDDFTWAVILPLLGAAFYATAMVITRARCRDEALISLIFALQGVFLITGALGTVLILAFAPPASSYPFIFANWGSMGAQEWGVLVLLALLSAGYFMGVARAYQLAPPSLVATFDYGYLISAALWGFVFFSEVPDLLTIVGIILIVLAGVLVVRPPKSQRP